MNKEAAIGATIYCVVRGTSVGCEPCARDAYSLNHGSYGRQLVAEGPEFRIREALRQCFLVLDMALARG